MNTLYVCSCIIILHKWTHGKLIYTIKNSRYANCINSCPYLYKSPLTCMCKLILGFQVFLFVFGVFFLVWGMGGYKSSRWRSIQKCSSDPLIVIFLSKSSVWGISFYLQMKVFFVYVKLGGFKAYVYKYMLYLHVLLVV